jgi:hypothetical protein
MTSAEPEKPIPADWGDEAQILFFNTESCGRITFPYEFKNVDLRETKTHSE